MNELSLLFLSVSDGDTIILDKNKIYDVRPEDSFIKTGYFCSNSAKQEENPDGTRYSAIVLENKRNITIDGNGATLLIHGKMTPLLFYGCENVTVRDLTIDYAVPTMTEFTVLESANGEITIKINDDCLWYTEDNKLYWHGERDNDGSYYWENACNAPKRYIKVYMPEASTTRDFNRNDLSFEKIDIVGENTLKCTLVNKEVQINEGEIFQTRNIIRDQVGSMFERCKNLYFENLRVMFMHGLGMVNQFCEDVTFRNCDFTPKYGRTIASTADFFQFSGCKGNITIENCKAFGAQDDYINVHGTHLQAVDCDRRENTLTVRFMHAESWGFQAFGVDDNIEFIRWDTLKAYSQARVLSFEKLSNTDIKLWVTHIPEELVIGRDSIENASYTPNLYVRGCDFGPTSGRGILATTRGEVIIENNRFCKLWGPALLIEDDCNFWFESGFTKNVIFRNNDVVSCNFGKTAEGAPLIQYSPKVLDKEYDGFVHGSLEVYGNRFLMSLNGNHTFYLSYLEKAEIYDNTFDAPFEIISESCGIVTKKNNITK